MTLFFFSCLIYGKCDKKSLSTENIIRFACILALSAVKSFAGQLTYLEPATARVTWPPRHFVPSTSHVHVVYPTPHLVCDTRLILIYNNMPYCKAYGCKNRGSEPGIFRHRFPEDPKLRDEWVHRCGRADFTIKDVNKASMMCSAHFEDSCYERSPKLLAGLGVKFKPSLKKVLFQWLQYVEPPPRPPILKPGGA